MVTLRCLARLQQASMVFFAAVGVCLLVCQLFHSRIDCQTADQSTKAEIENRCLKSDYYDWNEAKEIDAYNADYAKLAFDSLFTAFFYSFLWLLWKHWRPANGVGSDYLQDTVTKSGFTSMATSAYILLFYFQIENPFVAPLLASNHHRNSFARTVSCDIQKNEWSPLTSTSTCELPLNLVFQMAYQAISYWRLMLRVLVLIAHTRYSLYWISSGQRVSRLTALLSGLDERRINELAQDADTFFKIDSYADEIELKHSKRLEAH